MKILLIYNKYKTAGGEETYINGLIDSLKKHGHVVRTYIKQSNQLIKNPVKQLLTALNFTFNPRVYNDLSVLMREFKPDIVQCHNLFPLIGYAAYYAAKKNHIPLIQRVNNYRAMSLPWLSINKTKKSLFGTEQFSRRIRLLYSMSEFIHGLLHTHTIPSLYIFPSEFARKQHTAYALVPKKKSKAVPAFFVKNPCFRKRKRSDYFLYFGRLSEEKGIISLLKIFVSQPSLKLIVIGNGPLEHHARTYNTYKNITVYSRMSWNRLRNFLQQARFSIVPSKWYDVLPNTLIESFSQGTPVIAPHHGPFPSLIDPGKTGFLYKNPSELTALISTLSKKTSLPNKMLPHIQKTYKHNYTPDISYSRVIKIYKEVISQ